MKNILDEFETYDDYVDNEFVSGNIINISEVYYSEEDFNKHKEVNKNER